jgi:hypothetical protein
MQAGLGIVCSAILGSVLIVGCSGDDDDDAGTGGSAGTGASAGASASGGSAGSSAGRGGGSGASFAGQGGGGGDAAGKGGSGAAGTSAGGSSGAPSSRPNVDQNADVKDLDASEKATLCDWSQGLRGGYGVVSDCGNQMMRKTYDSQAQCLAIEFMGDCDLSVGEWETCQEALVPSNACNLPPECDVVTEC